MENNTTPSGFDAMVDILGENKTSINGFVGIDMFDDDSEDIEQEIQKSRIKVNTPASKTTVDQIVEEIDDNEEEEDDDIETPDLEEEEDDDEPDPQPEPKKRGRPRKEDQAPEDEPSNEAVQVTLFFDAVAEELGLELDEEDVKPDSVEGLVDYFKDIIAENSIPAYANEQMAELDEFVRNGGKLEDYVTITSEIDLDNVDVTSESDQERIVKEFLIEKGFSTSQINKKLKTYKDAGILEDEAEDALDELKDLKEAKKEKLLEDQKSKYEAAVNQQRQFVESVTSEIKSLSDIRGLKVPEKDKKKLLDYIFRTDNTGKSQFTKDFNKSVKNFVESAYFTMNGDTIIDNAKKSGSSSAIRNLKQSLSSNNPAKGTKRTPSTRKETAFDHAMKAFF